MNIKKLAVLIVFSMVASLGFALSMASMRTLEAFRRYEPDFVNSIRRLEELDRRIDNMEIDSGTTRYLDIMDEADEIMDRIQRRYNLMEDLFSSVSADYPADRADLFDGFSRIDDYYRQARDYHVLRFVNREQSPAKPETEEETAKEDRPERRKVDVSGVFRLDARNRNEIYRSQTKTTPNTLNERALPNNLSQARLSLKFQLSEDRELRIEDRFLRRKRNEPVHENYLTATYFAREGMNRAWTVKNTLQHTWYPDNTVKNYRNNLAEVFFNDRWKSRERLANAGFQARVYPGYSRSDFRQMNFSDQETWFKKWGTFFAEVKGNWRKYKNVDDLDYDNFNLYTEFNRAYDGNSSRLTVSNTYDRRLYDREAVNLFRASYYDNYLRATYELPVHDSLSYTFEGQHQKREYAADEARGYSELDMYAAARFRLDSDTRAQADYRYTYNDENTRARAHKNHKFHGLWQRSVTRDFRIRVDDTYHTRSSVVGTNMDFKENDLSLQLSWRLQNNMSFAWNNGYLIRNYDETFYRDYRYFTSGVMLSKVLPRDYDWKIEQSWRKFNFRNGNNTSTGWDGEAQPKTLLNYNFYLTDLVLVRLRASWEKSYYRSFDSVSQELLWDFTRPMTITEFYGGLEYTF